MYQFEVKNHKKNPTTRIPAGNAINLAFVLYQNHCMEWLKWTFNRKRLTKPPLENNLYYSTLTYHLAQQIKGEAQDLETSYAHVYALKGKIQRLQWANVLITFGSVLLSYILLGLLSFLTVFAIVSLAEQNVWLSVAVLILGLIATIMSFSFVFRLLSEIALADICLTQNPELKVWEAIKKSRNLVQNSNSWLIDLISTAILGNIFGWIFITLQIFILLLRLPFLVVTVPLIIVFAIIFIPYRSALIAARYTLLHNQKEGSDIQLRSANKSTMHFFKKVTLSTPESVELDFTLAGIGNRAFALLIDYLILTVTLTILAFVWIAVLGQLEDNSVLVQWFNAFMLLLYFVAYVGYFVYFEALWQGQTPGKRIAKIRVIQENGRPIGLQHATLRALLRPFDDPFSLGVLLIIFTKRERRIGDFIANTIVVQEEQRLTPAAIEVTQRAQEVCSFLLAEAKITVITADDFAVIKNYLQRRQNMDARARSEVSLRLAKELKEFLELEEIPAGVYPELFLEGIYLAYQENTSFLS